ncbi:hypothetical protein KQY27_00165 [Methanobrevibacter sp. TMH8]|uniref:hypothetical protein n=1 Tax=Methanobrevibacter sp. TMH8 TaxID=2848611 RepID=UPI001CCE9A02|nr:hypothetical protein [Methanobrevibacter sp. TMH8]MBZ9569972.1 hypothetical protein [Methanobrevibacter sp. TMH8]
MEERYKIHNKSVIWSENGDYWVIIILPDNIKVDNWHGYPHIHIGDEKKKISINNSYKAFLKVRLHINRESGVNLNKLLEELR